MADKARLTRKDIKQPDEFMVMSGQAVGWARTHRTQAIWGGAAVLVLIAVIGIATAYRSAQRRDANADLARAMGQLDADPAAATTALTEVANRWSGSAVAPLAELLAANSALRGGNADAAIAAVSAVDAGALPTYLQQQRLLTWGAALAAKQQWGEAAAKYEAAAALSGPYTGEALVGEARAREQVGETDKARELYRRAYEQFPTLPGRELLAAKFDARS